MERKFKGFVSLGCGKHPRNAIGGSSYKLDCLDCERAPMMAWFDGEPPAKDILQVLASALKKFAPEAVEIILEKVRQEQEGYEEFLAFLRS